MKKTMILLWCFVSVLMGALTTVAQEKATIAVLDLQSENVAKRMFLLH